MTQTDESSNYIDRVSSDDELIALIVRSKFHSDGIEFFTPDSFSQQLGYMNRPEGYRIPAHKHTLQPREVNVTNEVLFVKSGRVRVDLYNSHSDYVSSRVLAAGDIILLISGGHGFEMLEATEMIEVKQGPFVGAEDKVQIATVADADISVISS